MRNTTCLTCVLLLASACSSAAPAPICDAAALTAALASARSGDEVVIGACTIEGHFVVPSGVTLRGVDRIHSTVSGVGGTALTLTPSPAGVEPSTSLITLAVHSDGPAAVLARGQGSIALHELSVNVTRGMGIGLEDVDASLVDVDIAGPILLDSTGSAEAVTTPGDPAMTGTFGLVAVRADVIAAMVFARGFATAQLALVDGQAQINGFQAREGVGAGLAVSAGHATLSGGSIHAIASGTRPFSTGVHIDAAAALLLETTHIDAVQGFGVVAQGAADGDYDALVVSATQLPGFWAEASTAQRLHGAGTAIDAAGFASVVAIDTPITIRDALFTRSQSVTFNSVTAADGIQLVRPGPGSGVIDTVVVDQPRAGMIADGGGADHSDFTLMRMVATGTGTALGCVHQNGVFPASWDTGVERAPVVEANDESWETAGIPLDVADVIGPGMLVDLSSVRSGGLDAVL